jgi:5'-nucleotidase
MHKPQILLTNDDGIRSPGLWAAAQALSQIGFVTVVAPREQSSGMGRSLPITSDGIIREERVQVNGQEWAVYAVGGSPAQAVLHGILEVMPVRPHLVVSGINYGENVATGVSISGTVGAAMEGAALGIPSLAVSQQTPIDKHLSYSDEVDFSAAAYFAAHFGRLLLDGKLPPAVELLKVDVPSDARPDTEWELARLSRQRYFRPLASNRTSWSAPGPINYELAVRLDTEPRGTDVDVLLRKKRVAVVPLCLDFTAQVDFKDLDHRLRG